MSVDRRLGMVVTPVEPVVLQRRDAVEAFALCWSGRGAALKVPLAAGHSVEQRPFFFLGGDICVGVSLQEEFGILPINAADESAERFFVGPKDNQQRRAVDAIENRGLLDESSPRVCASGALHRKPDYNIARLDLGAGKADDDRQLGHVRLPVGVVLFRVPGDGREHLAGWRFCSPLAEGEFVAEYQFERSALQRAIDGLPGDLLPPASGFFVAHEEVLVVDSGEIKMQGSSVYRSRPHQTGVTERSIGDCHRHATYHIVKNMVVGHLVDGIGAGVTAEAHGHDHFFRIELAL
jgi:hypothetical protein